MSEEPPTKRARSQQQNPAVYMGKIRGHEPFKRVKNYDDSPIYVKSLSEGGIEVKQVSCCVGSGNTDMAYILTTDGQLKPWAAFDALDDNSEELPTPWYWRDQDQRSILPTVLNNVSFVVSGFGFHVAATEDGSIYTWTSDDGKKTDLSPFKFQPWESIKAKVKTICLAHERDMYKKQYTPHLHCVLVLTENGDVYSWGDNVAGTRGTADEDAPKDVPTKILEEVVSISSLEEHVGAVTSKGLLYTWGTGELGYNRKKSGVPRCVKKLLPSELQGDKIVQVACGDGHTLALSSSGKVYSFGSDGSKQLGLGTHGGARNLPIWVFFNLLERKIVKIVAGDKTSFAISSEGELLRWGETIVSIKYKRRLPRYEVMESGFIKMPTVEERFKDRHVRDIQSCGNSFFVLVDPQDNES